MCFGNLLPRTARTSSFGLADEVVDEREPAQVGRGLQVPDDDATIHGVEHATGRM